MKKSYTLLITLFTILFVSFAIISFMNYFSLNKNSQYRKDLAELRGYWATYAARKEFRQVTAVTYSYSDSTVQKNLYNVNSFYNLDNSNPGYMYSITSSDTIENKDLNRRILFVDGTSENNNIIRYSKD